MLARCSGQVSLPLKGKGRWVEVRGRRRRKAVGGRRVNPPPRDATNYAVAPFLSFFLSPAFLFPCSPRGRGSVSVRRPVEQLLPVTGRCGWMCVRNAPCVALHVPLSNSTCLSMEPRLPVPPLPETRAASFCSFLFFGGFVCCCSQSTRVSSALSTTRRV